ncbi:MAG: hypothetical protein KGI54_15570 [Pseudomonadota bacterium]|nr:hypothetical protein [Pseudomonadota bacterium]
MSGSFIRRDSLLLNILSIPSRHEITGTRMDEHDKIAIHFIMLRGDAVMVTMRIYPMMI